MEEPLISVIIPVYNGQNYLRESIGSVLGQSFAEKELLVVDDGSTDDTPAIAASYGSKLRYIRQENRGVAAAVNHGIQQARGKYIAWLSHDDVFLPGKLERQADFLRQQPQFEACYTDFYVINPEGKVIGEVTTPWHPRERAVRHLFGRMYINGSSMLIARECFEAVGLFKEEYRYCQDAEMWLRMLTRFEIGRVPEKLLKWRYHPGQGSRLRDEAKAEKQVMYSRVLEELGVEGVFPEHSSSASDPERQAWFHTWFGDIMALHRGWYDYANRYYRTAVAAWPSWRNPAKAKLALGAGLVWGPVRQFNILQKAIRLRLFKQIPQLAERR